MVRFDLSVTVLAQLLSFYVPKFHEVFGCSAFVLQKLKPKSQQLSPQYSLWCASGQRFFTMRLGVAHACRAFILLLATSHVFSKAQIVISPSGGKPVTIPGGSPASPIIISVSATSTLRFTVGPRHNGEEDVVTAADGLLASTTAPPRAPSITPPPVSSTGLYTLPSLPGARSAPLCVAACLLPDTFGDLACASASTGNDTSFGLVSDNCACVASPLDAVDAVTDCILQSCGLAPGTAIDSVGVSAGISTATSLYQSYCLDKFGSAALASATSAENAVGTRTTPLGGASPTRTGMGATSSAAAPAPLRRPEADAR